MRFIVDVEDNSLTADDVRNVLNNSPYDLGWLTVTDAPEPEPAPDIARAEDPATVTAAMDEYRRNIVRTIPAHRLETRQQGFVDGWSAAVRFLRGSRA